MPRLYGLIGYPLSHTFSPAYFKKKFVIQHIDALYEPFPLVNINEFPALIQSYPHLLGLNVTIPYKGSVIPYLDEMDNIAIEIEAVNCIAFRDGRKKGYNTDAIGFERSLLQILQPQHTHALLLGTGGASRAVGYVLKRLGIIFHRVSRNKTEDGFIYEEITPEIIDQYKLIINTTPLGMYPNNDASPPIPYDGISNFHLLYDLIYNPEETQFLSLGKARGASIKNGFEMLQLQADASWEIWQQ